jgi:hypothetical protein
MGSEGGLHEDQIPFRERLGCVALVHCLRFCFSAALRPISSALSTMSTCGLWSMGAVIQNIRVRVGLAKFCRAL